MQDSDARFADVDHALDWNLKEISQFSLVRNLLPSTGFQNENSVAGNILGGLLLRFLIFNELPSAKFRIRECPLPPIQPGGSPNSVPSR